MKTKKTNLKRHFVRKILLLVALLAVSLLHQSPLMAIKIPIDPEVLQGSKLIIVGVVKSFRRIDHQYVQDIILELNIETVEKGHEVAKASETINVKCWKPARPGPDGFIWEQGNDFVPSVGGRAKFFLEHQSNQTWESQWPNGIEALDEIPGIKVEGHTAPFVPKDSPQESPEVSPQSAAEKPTFLIPQTTRESSDPEWPITLMIVTGLFATLSIWIFIKLMYGTK